MVATVTNGGQQSLYDTNLGPNDVLLGRGAPFLNYQGNKRFRAYVKTQRMIYTTSGRNRMKNEIARQVIQEIGRRGGRFLVCVTDETIRAKLNVPQGTRLWKVAEEETVMEKCKQALRDKDPASSSTSSRNSQTAIRDHLSSSGSSTVTTMPHSCASSASRTIPIPRQPSSLWPTLPPQQQQQQQQETMAALPTASSLPPQQQQQQQPAIDVASLAGLIGALTQQNASGTATTVSPQLPPTPLPPANFGGGQPMQQQPPLLSMPTVVPTAVTNHLFQQQQQQVPPAAQAPQQLQSQLAAALQELQRQQEQARQLQALGQCLVSTGQQLQAALVNDPSAATVTRQALAQQAQLLQALLASGIMGGRDNPPPQQQQQHQQLLLQLLQQQQQQLPQMSTLPPPTTNNTTSTNAATTSNTTSTTLSQKPSPVPPRRKQQQQQDSFPTNPPATNSVDTFPTPDSDIGEYFVRDSEGSTLSQNGSSAPSFKLSWMANTDETGNGVVSEFTTESQESGPGSISVTRGEEKQLSSLEGSDESSDSDQPRSSSTEGRQPQTASDSSESSDQEVDNPKQQQQQQENKAEGTHSSSDGDVSSN